MHVNSREVTTKDISNVDSGISRKLNDWFPSVCLSWPYAVFATIVNMYMETNSVCGSAGNEATVHCVPCC